MGIVSREDRKEEDGPGRAKGVNEVIVYGLVGSTCYQGRTKVGRVSDNAGNIDR